MTRPMRVALAGAGMISEFHLIAWSRLPQVEVVAIADPDEGRARARAGAFGIPRWYPDLEALLATERVDAVDIASPRQTHSALVRLAASHGLPVLCQKPLAPTLEEAEKLIRDVAGRIRLMVHENWRFRPYYRQIKAWLDSGQVGRISSASIAVHSSGLVPDADGHYPALARQPFFRSERRLLVAETLIHHIDVARFLFGPLRLVGARLVRATEVVLGETAAALLFETTNGAPVLVDGNLTCHGLTSATRDRVSIFGDRASVTMVKDRLALHKGQPIAIEYEHATAYQACFDDAIGHFVDCLRTGAPFETSPQDNLETLRLTEAAYANGVTDHVRGEART